MLWGINQGGTYPDIRIDHMKRIADLDLPGYAIGGLAVGETAQEMYDIIDAIEPYMPREKTRYLMGVGTPTNIIEGVARGVDFFDCVMPARNARHARLFTWEGAINLKNAKYQLDDSPIDPQCDCPVCRRYSRRHPPSVRGGGNAGYAPERDAQSVFLPTNMQKSGDVDGGDVSPE